MNQVILIGRVGKDPAIREVGQNNIKIAEFSIATSKNIGNYQNPNWVSTWHNIKCWKKQAEFAEANIRKGDEVFISGEIEVQQWEDREGKKQYRTNIVADTVRVTKVGEAKNDAPPPPESEYAEDPAYSNQGGGSRRDQNQQSRERW